MIGKRKSPDNHNPNKFSDKTNENSDPGPCSQTKKQKLGDPNKENQNQNEKPGQGQLRSKSQNQGQSHAQKNHRPPVNNSTSIKATNKNVVAPSIAEDKPIPLYASTPNGRCKSTEGTQVYQSRQFRNLRSNRNVQVNRIPPSNPNHKEQQHLDLETNDNHNHHKLSSKTGLTAKTIAGQHRQCQRKCKCQAHCPVHGHNQVNAPASRHFPAQPQFRNAQHNQLELFDNQCSKETLKELRKEIATGNEERLAMQAEIEILKRMIKEAQMGREVEPGRTNGRRENSVERQQHQRPVPARGQSQGQGQGQVADEDDERETEEEETDDYESDEESCDDSSCNCSSDDCEDEEDEDEEVEGGQREEENDEWYYDQSQDEEVCSPINSPACEKSSDFELEFSLCESETGEGKRLMENHGKVMKHRNQQIKKANRKLQKKIAELNYTLNETLEDETMPILSVADTTDDGYSTNEMITALTSPPILTDESRFEQTQIAQTAPERASCPHCNNVLLSRNIKRHITGNCKIYRMSINQTKTRINARLK